MVIGRRSFDRSHRKSVRAVILAGCLLLVTGCAQSTIAADDGDASGVPEGGRSSGGDVQPGQSSVYFPAWDAPEDVAATARFEGELVIGADNCLYLRSMSGDLVLGIWPREFTWSSEPPGVRGAGGQVLRVGERFAAPAATGSEEVKFRQCTETGSTINLWPPERL